MSTLPKKLQCDNDGHSWWEWVTLSGKKYGKCQRCGIDKVLYDPHPKETERRSDPTIEGILKSLSPGCRAVE